MKGKERKLIIALVLLLVVLTITWLGTKSVFWFFAILSSNFLFELALKGLDD